MFRKLRGYTPALTSVHHNAKLGRGVLHTSASQITCPASCPLRRAGCYAEGGRVGLISRDLNAVAQRDGHTAESVIRLEAGLIRGLNPTKPLRLHVVGDAPTERCAAILADACAERTGPTWTYTHAWRDVRRLAWGGVQVWASLDSPAQMEQAEEQGYQQMALVVAEHKSASARLEKGRLHIPCPAQTKQGVTCAKCRICWHGPERWRHRGVDSVVVEFAVHGRSHRAVKAALNLE